MIEVRIVSLNADAATGQPIVLLQPVSAAPPDADERMLPIWIGHPEATAILLALEGEEFPRPMTHDLLKNLIELLGFQVTRVEVTRLEEGTYFAGIVMRGEERELIIDARPSDSIALALRVGCPVYVADDVFERAAVNVTAVDETEQEVERFRDFLNHVDPSDFTS
ncbi:MAG: bifunctional nuclease family protein [Coriobacteriia bacterium]